MVEKGRGLGGGEAEVAFAQFGHLAPAAQARQGQWRVVAGGDGQVHAGRLALDQEAKGLVDGQLGDGVVIVEDEEEPAPGRDVEGRGDVVDERGDEAFQGRQLGRGDEALEATRLAIAGLGRDVLQGGGEVGEKAGRVVVPIVEGEPGGAQ